MGTDCLVRVVGEAGDAFLLDEAEALVEQLEARWSRFRAGSELSVLNAHAGAPVFVSTETATLVALALDASRATGGRFDPTVHDALVATGYDRTFEDLDDVVDAAPGATAVPGVAGIEVDLRSGLVVVPPGCRLDLGGIGKGRAADLVLDRLVTMGATGACVDLGGDVRVGGSTASGADDWVVAVDDPFAPGSDLVTLRLAAGAVATSSRTRRRWATAAGDAHHLIDPSTGRPAAAGLTAVTVVGAEAAWAEAHAKAALIAGPSDGLALVERAGLSGVLVTDAGGVLVAGPVEDFLVGEMAVRSSGHPPGGGR
jgi:thiamine biosynthesis lipoprotein